MRVFHGPARMITTTARRVPPVLALLAILFFVSGTSALIYQVLWLRLLGLGLWRDGLRGQHRLGRVHGWSRARQSGRRPSRRSRPAPSRLAGQRAYAALHPTLNSSLVTLTFVRLLISLAVLIVPSSLRARRCR
jgi:hypothetical protein